MNYIGEDKEYYNNFNNNNNNNNNNYYTNDWNRNIAYGSTHNSYENPNMYGLRNSDIYQYNNRLNNFNLNDNYYDIRNDQGIDKRILGNYSEEEFLPSCFIDPRKVKENRKNLYPMNNISNSFEDENIYYIEKDENRKSYRSANSKQSNKSNSFHSNIINPNIEGLNINVNGINIKNNKNNKINKIEEESFKSWIPLRNTERIINEDNDLFINEDEYENQYEEDINDYSEEYSNYENINNGRTTIININCSNLNNNNSNNNCRNKIFKNSDSEYEEDEDENEENEDEITKQNISKKPIRPKKIFMGKYLFSDLKDSLIYPLTICAHHPTPIIPNPKYPHYKIYPKSRREKEKKPEIIVRY